MLHSTSLSSRTSSASSSPSSSTQSLRTSSAISAGIALLHPHTPLRPPAVKKSAFAHQTANTSNRTRVARQLPLDYRIDPGPYHRAASHPDHNGAGTLPKYPPDPLCLDELGRPPLLKLLSTPGPFSTSLPAPPVLVPSLQPCSPAASANKTSSEKDRGQYNSDSVHGDRSGEHSDRSIHEGCKAVEIMERVELVATAPQTSAEHPSSPLTPIPMDSCPYSGHVAMRTTSFSASAGQLPSLPSSTITQSTSPSIDQHENILQPSTPRSRLKPSPIATRLPSRPSAPSLAGAGAHPDWEHIHNNAAQTTSTCIGPQSRQCDSPESDKDRSADVGGRDSGIALESWDIPKSQSDIVQGECQTHEGNASTLKSSPTTEQPLRPEWDTPDPFQTAGDQRRHVGQTPERRQRCRSMICPVTSRATEIDDPLPHSSEERSSTSADATDSHPASSTPAGTGPKVRGKRVSSMSLGSTPALSHDLPPLPPKGIGTSAPRTSFFVSPLLQDEGTGVDQTSFQRRALSTSVSSLSSSSSSSSSSASATISLSRAPSPSLSSMAMPSQGIPFSNMLDLATAKAENITGLYYAKQMNRKSASFYALKDPLNTSSESEVQSLLSSPSQHERQSLGTSQDPAHIRIEVDAPTPIMARTPYAPTAENARVASSSHSHSVFSPTAKRSRTLTSAEPAGSLQHSKTYMETSFDPTSSANSRDLAPSHPPPSTPTRAQHRRSHSASHFFHLSSLKHHSPAQFNLALCYEHGQGGVDKDLEKAIYFYQQAADQGHTKASYNIGCICYNEGEVSKAMAWFESAGKCSIRGLRMEATEQPAPGCNLSDPSSKYPIPRQTSLPHELEDMLLGNSAATSGPFAAYLPAILCLALLCRQGVQTRDGAVILKKDPEQSVELLQKVLDRAPPQSHSSDDEDSSERAGDDGFGGVSLGRRKPAPQDASIQAGSSFLSTSCPSLPLGNRCSDRPKDAPSNLAVSSASQPSRERVRRRATVEDEVDVDMPQARGPVNTHAQEMRKERILDRPLDVNGSDDHETWSVILAQQLLKVWKPSKSTATAALSADLSAEAERKSKRILRHHLLYITNPTLGKNLYNLGVLYDLYLGNAAIAIRCYRAAYQNSHNSQTAQDSLTESLLQHGDPRQEIDQQEQEQRGLVTRINSAWNLGVLHVRRKEWGLAQEWFVRAQRDVLLHERQQQRDREHGRRSLVNVVPHGGSTLPLDSPGKRHAHEHGLMMHLGAMAYSGSGAGARVGVSRKSSKAGVQQSGDRTGGLGGREDLPEDGIRTDASKVSWVMRWVESQMEA